MRKLRGIVSMCAASMLLCAVAHGGNWPQWRGQNFNGTAEDTVLPDIWSDTNNTLWIAPLPGPGSATPVIWRDRVFVSSTDKADGSVLALCLDARTGSNLWRRPMGKDRPTQHGNTMAAPSPATDGTNVWFLSGNGDLAAFDIKGKELWRRDLADEYGPFALKFGYGSSPLLYRGTLYVLVLRNTKATKYGATAKSDAPLDSYLLAVDPSTGKTRWRHTRVSDVPDESVEAYSSPVPCEQLGAVLVAGAECLTAHDLATGKEQWRWGYEPVVKADMQRLVPSPLVDQGNIYIVRPRHQPLFALSLSSSSSAKPTVKWSNKELTPDVITPAMYRGRLYSMHDDQRVLVCMNPATGAVEWQLKLASKGPFRASPTVADGKVYVISEQGEIFVVKADKGELVFSIATDEKPCHSSIAVANGCLYIRTAKNLRCVRKKE